MKTPQPLLLPKSKARLASAALFVQTLPDGQVAIRPPVASCYICANRSGSGYAGPVASGSLPDTTCRCTIGRPRHRHGRMMLLQPWSGYVKELRGYRWYGLLFVVVRNSSCASPGASTPPAASEISPKMSHALGICGSEGRPWNYRNGCTPACLAGLTRARIPGYLDPAPAAAAQTRSTDSAKRNTRQQRLGAARRRGAAPRERTSCKPARARSGRTLGHVEFAVQAGRARCKNIETGTASHAPLTLSDQGLHPQSTAIKVDRQGKLYSATVATIVFIIVIHAARRNCCATRDARFPARPRHIFISNRPRSRTGGNTLDDTGWMDTAMLDLQFRRATKRRQRAMDSGRSRVQVA